MIKEWYIQLLILILVWLILTLLKKRFFRKQLKNFKRLDVMSLFLVVAIHFLSQDVMGLSIILFLICGLSAYGLIMTILYALMEGQILYKKFLIKFWRVADILFLGTYCVLLIFKIVSFFN